MATGDHPQPPNGPDDPFSSADPGTPGAEDTQVLAGGEPPPGRRNRTTLIAVTAAVLVVLVAGGTYAVRTLAGGGTQPEEVVPSNALAFTDVDLDPAAGQKIAAVRYLRHFEPFMDELKEEGDIRKTLFEAVADDTDALRGVSFDEDVAPWLGQRAAVAVLPTASGSGPEPVAALQVSDEGEARQGVRHLLDTMAENSGQGTAAGLVVRDGYAIVAQSQQVAARASKQAESKSLADDSTFAADMASLGTPGVATSWVDMARLGKQLSRSLPGQLREAASAGYSGRMAYAIRFDAGYAELAGRMFGWKGAPQLSGSAPNHISELPQSTVAAYSLTHGDQYVHSAWQRYDRLLQQVQPGISLDELTAQLDAFYGIRLPEDLQTLLGKSFVLALDGRGLDGGTPPRAGARVDTDTGDANGVLDRVDRLARDQGIALPFVRRDTERGIILASTRSYAERLDASGDLGQQEAFVKAAPGAAKADQALWVDVDRLVGQFSGQFGTGPGDRRALEVLRSVDGVGMTAQVQSKGEAAFQIRVLAR
ncbi:MAG: DUF3352 domain-containing protein [Streptomycetales bacterium]